MNRTKKIYLLFGIFLATCVVTFILSNIEEQKEKIKNSDEIILEIDNDTVNKLSWEYDSKNLAFHKDEYWQYDDDEAFPVDEEKINELLELFQAFGVSFIIEDVEDYGQYGLDDPECTITLETKEKTYEIVLGDYSIMDSERYVSIGDGNAYLVKDDPLEYFDVELKDMIKDDETPDFEKVKAINFSGNTSLEVIYEEGSSSTYCEDDVYFVKEDSKYLPLDTSLVEEYLEKLSGLDQENYVTYNVSEEDLKNYYLDSPEFSVQVTYIEETEDGEEEKESTFIMHVGCNEEEKDEDEYSAYVRIGDSKIIYEINNDDYEEIVKASYDSLRHREVVTADLADVSQIEVSLEKSSYTITVDEKNDELICTYQDEEIESDDFLDAIENLKADSFTNEEASQKKEIEFTIQFKDKKYPKMKVEIYRYDGEFCLVVIDGESVSLVERSSTVDLVESVNAIVLN